MSRSVNEWNEQLAHAVKVRNRIYVAQDALDDIDTGRFGEASDAVQDLDNILRDAVSVANRVIGALTIAR